MQEGLSHRRVRFGGFELDVRSRELRRAGARVRLPDQSRDLSRDGARLVFIAARPNSGQHRDQVARDLSTGNERVIRVVDDDRGPILFPRWSHDGMHLSYTAVTRTTPDAAHQQVLVSDPATGHERPLTSLTTVHALDFPTDWTPDGRFTVSRAARAARSTCQAPAEPAWPSSMHATAPLRRG